MSNLVFFKQVYRLKYIDNRVTFISQNFVTVTKWTAVVDLMVKT